MMDTFTSDSGSSGSTENKREFGCAAKSKKRYLVPKLVCYGSVASLTRNGGAASADGTGNSMTQTMGSDRSIKENVVKIDVHPHGVGLYLFDYKPEYREAWGHGRRFGLMADEVEHVMPEAVSVHPDGYKVVNYAMLGITRTLQ